MNKLSYFGRVTGETRAKLGVDTLDGSIVNDCSGGFVQGTQNGADPC